LPGLSSRSGTAEKRIVVFNFREPVRVGLRLLNYPAWRVEVNGKAVTPQRAESTDQIVLVLAPGTERVTAKFVRTPDRKVGIGVSVFSLLVLLALLNAGGVRLLSARPVIMKRAQPRLACH